MGEGVASGGGGRGRGKDVSGKSILIGEEDDGGRGSSGGGAVVVAMFFLVRWNRRAFVNVDHIALTSHGVQPMSCLIWQHRRKIEKI